MENGELKEYKGIGICYDGPFHRKQIFKKQSLKQVQAPYCPLKKYYV
jgi:hypothetical protein